MLLLLLLLVASAAASQIALSPGVLRERALVIGPFPIGTRESPLSTSDAWRTPITGSAPSALGRNGSVDWHGVDVIDGRIAFQFDVDWPTLSDGWGGQQYEAFALLDFDAMHDDLNDYRISADGASEIGIQRGCVGEPQWHTADYYSSRRAGSHAYLWLGRHCFYVRYVHDVRVRGADAVGSVKLTIEPATRVRIGDILAPDHGYGEYLSVEVVNDSPEWMCATFDGDLELVRSSTIGLAPDARRPLSSAPPNALHHGKSVRSALASRLPTRASTPP